MSLRYILPLLLIVCVSAWMSFRPQQAAESPARQIDARFKAALEQLDQETEKLLSAAQLLDKRQSLEVLRNQLIATRLQFKKTEALASQLSAEFVKDYFNGPPLPKIERNAPSRVTVLEPEGLQILDELIFSETALEEKEVIIAKATTLRKQSARFLSSQSARKPLTDRLVLEAQRAELIRLFTQGLTGFDVPASGNTLPEARQVWQTLTEDVSPYLELLAPEKRSLAQNIRTYLDKGDALLKANEDFDRFDRLGFLREALNPLFGALYDLHMALGIETYYETAASPKPQQYFARDLFSPDFLDALYYVPLSSKDPKVAQKRELGKLLFFDPILSGENERACASCHNPARAFTDGAPKSIALGFNGTVDRNAPTLVNAVYSERYFHDLRADDLTTQIEGVVVNEKEFHTDFFAIADKLNQSPEYVALFREAFPEEGRQPINRQSITLAIGSYIASLTSWNSPFDRYARGESQTLDESAKRGFNLFMGKAACGTCHFAPVFNGTVPPEYVESESEVLGVPLTPALKHATPDPDEGRFANKRAAEKADFQRYAFKTPTLRNIALTAPYMHNGAYMTLEQIMDFYNKGGGAGIGIPLPNQTLPTDPLNLSKREIGDIISFMKALTDTTGITSVPTRLPAFPEGSAFNQRPLGGKY